MSVLITMAKAIAAVWVIGVALTLLAWMRGAITLYRHHWDGFLNVWGESEDLVDRAVLVAVGPLAIPRFTSTQEEVLDNVG